MELCFFFQAEDGIRDYDVTGVQTCALPISKIGCIPFHKRNRPRRNSHRDQTTGRQFSEPFSQIGRASCRERV